MHKAIVFLSLCTALPAQTPAKTPPQPQLPSQALAIQHFGNDAPWYLANIPFLEIDDPEIQQIYYYRWQLYRSHIREIGPQGTTVTEFLPDVLWARHPFTDLNDSASFHLLEGRWLRDPTAVLNLIDHLYTGGANDRHFSESIAAATEAVTRVTGDPTPGLRHLDTMQHIFNLWDDHLDRTRNLYWIEPLLDATEYTIASIDASGAGFTDTPSTDQNRNGFTGGQAFRPSINAYQYGNALAIARFAALAHQPAVAADYTARAEALRAAVLTQLWNPTLQHFTDRYQRSTPTTRAGDFIRGRELVGYVPWQFELPPTAPPSKLSLTDPHVRVPHSSQSHPDEWDPQTSPTQAFSHVLNPTELAGPQGLRTVEPTYPRYLHQYRYDTPTNQPECQWNGPSWPFQTSQTLTALANLLDDYPPASVTPADYLRLLRQYTHQHLLPSGIPDLQEDYNPDTGAPVVGLPRSHHYNHSTYIDLILTGLLGIRPRADNILELNPLIPTTGELPMRYFALQNLAYHGHTLALFYDRDNTRYHLGPGLTVFLDGHHLTGPTPLAHLKLPIPGPIQNPASYNQRSSRPNATRSAAPVDNPRSSRPKAERSAAAVERPPNLPSSAPPPSPIRRIDLAVNPGTPTFPTATASSTQTPTGIAEAIDGRLWFFPEIPNGWSPIPTDPSPTYTLDFGEPRTLTSIELYFLADQTHTAPTTYTLETQTPTGWRPVPSQTATPPKPIANGENRITFPPTTTRQLRIRFPPTNLRLIELKAFNEPGTP